MIDKLLVVGWDGATWSYIDPLLEKGKLPALAALLSQGARATLHSTLPPYTHIAWPSLVTGLSPARTGVFDGARIRRGSYEAVPSSLTGHRGIPIWHWVNRYGRRAGVLNVPMTFPAVPLDGYLVSGFDSPRRSPGLAYPRDLLARWAAKGRSYRILEDEIALMGRQNPHQRRGDLEAFTAGWVKLTEAQGELTAWLWNNEPVDLVFTVFSGTDSINHRTNDGEPIARVYQSADRALGRILEAISERTLVCVVSDHGSVPAERYISLYHALHEAGWLRFRARVSQRAVQRLPGGLGAMAGALWERTPGSIQKWMSWPLLRLDGRLASSYDNVDWERTRVYARTGMGPLYLNLTGREPQGSVPASDYGSFRDEVSRAIVALRDDRGQALFGQVWRGEDLHPGADPADGAPDLLFEPARWSDHVITGYPSDPLVRPVPVDRPYGTHTPFGILALAGPGVRPGVDLDRVDILDVVPTLLAAWGCPIPDEAEGEVAQKAFLEPLRVKRDSAEEARRPERRDTPDEAQEILRRLRALGYLE